MLNRIFMNNLTIYEPKISLGGKYIQSFLVAKVGKVFGA